MGRSGSRRGRGEPQSSSSASSSSSSLAKKHPSQSINPKRHSLDSIHPNSSSNHSSAIPRGNGYQAMSIPMPPPPSLYFSLLPSSSGSNGSTSNQQQQQQQQQPSGSGSHSNSNSPRPSPAVLSHTSNNTGLLGKQRSKSTSAKNRQPRLHHHPPSIQFHLELHSEPTTPAGASHPAFLNNNNSSRSTSNLHPQSLSNPSTPAIPPASTGGFNHYHTLHHPPRGSYPLSMTHSRRSSLSQPYGGGSSEKSDPQRQKGGFFDMAIFDPAPDVRPKSARSSVDHERLSHRMTVSRPPSIESINSANSVPFAPPPPPPPSAWKRFTNHFSRRVIKRHVKFIIALYISSALALITPLAHQLGPTPYLANVAVVFMHPSRTVGSQLEVTFFSVIGGILAAAWILPCQVAVAAFNQRYLPGGNTSAWAIEAAWFFLGVWIMTLYKTRYAKLNCTFIIYTIAGIFALTTGRVSMQFDFFHFWNLMGPLMIGIAICLVVSIVFWPETASEGLGRALNESMDTSRSLLNLSTRAFLLNHKTIALPKSAIDKAQGEVRLAQKKLFSAYREARYEVTYSRTNPADYKEVKTIVSALMRHLASMSLVVQNERLLMLGHPDRDDEDLMTQSGGESDTSFATSDSSSESESDSDSEGRAHARERPSQSNRRSNSGEPADYFGNATADSVTGKGYRSRNRRNKKSETVDSPPSEDGHDERNHRRVRRRGSAAELRRIRQLLQRAENSTQATMKTKQQQQETAKKETLQQTFQFDRGGFVTAPPTPGGRGVFNVFGYHQAHRSKNSSGEQRIGLETTETLRPSSGQPSNATTPNSSRPSSIYEEANLDTVMSFKSLFSIKSVSKFKSNRPSSLKAGFKQSNSKWGKLRGDTIDEHSPGIPLDGHYATMPAGAISDDDHLNSRHYRTVGGIRFGTSLTDQQVRKAAEAYRKKQEKQVRRERKQAERERKAEEQRLEKQEQAVAAARAIPPKEVAFGDRKLFMSFLDIVQDPLQRLSDSCSRVMVALEMELVSGLNVEQDRLERIQRRNAQREAAIRAAEAKKAEEEKLAANGATVNTNAAGTEAAPCENPKDKTGTGLTALDRLRVLVGVKPHKLSKADLDYAEALKSSMGLGLSSGDKGKKGGKSAKDPKSANTVHPNKFLHQDRKMTSSGIEEEDDLALPPGMSCVQYLTQELEIFDKAEAQGLQDFIATHPTLDVGPREEIFLIFFFLFALREIARELLRLGKYVEELEEQEQRVMEREGRLKRKKKLWWPKVFGNFWHWFAWGSYSQVKTSEGYNALIRNSAKNLEHRQPMSVEQEKVIVEAKAAKATADKLAAEVAAEAAAEKKEELQRRLTQPGGPIPLRRTVTLSTFIHRRGHGVDLEQGHDRHPRGREKEPQERRSRSNTRLRTGNDWTSERPRRHRSHQRLFGNSHMLQEVAQTAPKPDLGDPYVLGNREDLQSSPEQEESIEHTEKTASKRAAQYTVVDIPSFGSLQHKNKEGLRHFDDANQVELLPKIHVIKPSHTAPPELDINKLFINRKSPLSPDSDAGEGPSTGFFPPAGLSSSPVVSPRHQLPSFSSSTSPALLSDHSLSSNPVAKTSRKQDSHTVDSDSTDSDSEHHSGKKDKKGRARNLFAGFSRRHSSEENPSESSSLSRKLSPAPPTPEPRRPPRTIFVNVPKPKTWRYWVWEHLQPFKSEEFKFGFKMAFALSFIGLWSWLEWNNTPLATDRGQWAMMTVMAVLSPTVGATFSVCAMRVAGTLAGTLWALITYLAFPRNPWVICVFMLVVAFASVFLILESAHPKLGIIMLLSYSSVTFIKYEDHTTETIYEVCYKRAITVIIGIIISVMMNSLLWPILARRELRKEIAVLIGRQGVLFAELVNKFFLEEQHDGQEGHSHYVANWPENIRDDDEDEAGEEEEFNEKAELARRLEAEHVHDSFVERAERAERVAHQFATNKEGGRRKVSASTRSRSEGQVTTSKVSQTTDLDHASNKSGELPHQVPPEMADPDRLAFQHVEQQLQTKLIKINQLLELSGSEPRLKEQFPMKLYNQIIQCCQNILDRMVSMRMAAQLISPEVRELVTGPMNYYRRDMVGALLLYFSVLSSSLASKSPLPPYLPSARVARLRVIYNVREAIAAHQAVTKEDHYTYIYYYAFSSALEEVIEELELLAILIKPIVGVTLVSSGNRAYDSAGGFTSDEFNFGTAIQTNCIGLPDASALPHPESGSDNLGQELAAGLAAGLMQQDSSLVGSSTRIPAMMVNIAASDSTTAGMGAGAFGQHHPQLPLHFTHLQHQQPPHDLEKGHEHQDLEYPHDLLHEQQQKLMQDQLKMQQMQQQIEAQQKVIQQQQVQIQQQQKAYNFHPDMAIATPNARAPLTGGSNNNNPGGNLAGGSGSKSSLLSGHSATGSMGGHGNKDKRPSLIESEIFSSSAAAAASGAHHQRNRRISTTLKLKTGGLHVDIPSATSASVPQTGGPATNATATLGGMKLPPAAMALATSPIIMMDESLLGGGRHSQRFKEAIQVAQEASGQKVIEVRSPSVATSGVLVIPGQVQVQLPMGASSTGSTTKKSGGSSSIVPTLKKMISPAAISSTSATSAAAAVAVPAKSTTAGPSGGHGGHVPNVTATLPGPQQHSQPHQQRMQRPPVHPFVSQKSQSSISGHGHFSDSSITSGGEGASNAAISSSLAAPFVLSLPARIVVPTSVTSPNPSSSST